MRIADSLSVVAALALVVGLIVLIRVGARYVATRRPQNASTQLRSIGHLGLDGKRRLHLIQCGTGQVLLLTGGASDLMLPWPGPDHSP